MFYDIFVLLKFHVHLFDDNLKPPSLSELTPRKSLIKGITWNSLLRTCSVLLM